MQVEGFVLLFTVMFHIGGGPCVENWPTASCLSAISYLCLPIFMPWTTPRMCRGRRGGRARGPPLGPWGSEGFARGRCAALLADVQLTRGYSEANASQYSSNPSNSNKVYIIDKNSMDNRSAIIKTHIYTYLKRERDAPVAYCHPIAYCSPTTDR